MKLGRAYGCHDCEEIFENAPLGKCPACESSNVEPLGWLTRPAEEKDAWLKRVSRGKKSPRPLSERI
jgi:hypothetical protein